jgi:acyl-CoA thioester hydrolase
MPAIFEHTVLVTDGVIDDLNHANNAAYVGWMQEAAMAHSTANGWPAERYHQENAGWVVKSHSIDYLAPAFLGNQIAIRTWVSKMRKVVSWRRYDFVRMEDSQTLVRAETKWAYVDFKTLKPRQVPVVFLEDFVVVDEENLQRTPGGT